MSSKGVKQLLFEQFARVGKAMSNANRLEILEFLAQSECNVEELSKLAGITVANTSQHLQQLRQAGLVNSRKQGLKVYYSLSGDDVIELLSIQRKVAERHIAEVDQLIDHFLTVKDSLEPLPREELLSRVKQGLVTIIDVRPASEYDAGHV
ncbi:MAG: metalloregulator ArsR/SmtB family transcription factor, partial [Gammaproteobacteria bacterium]|nr:metalloregulator ArsR/SmtB family transcription factor [Gammaproteobacteria bacterium]